MYILRILFSKTYLPWEIKCIYYIYAHPLYFTVTIITRELFVRNLKNNSRSMIPSLCKLVLGYRALGDRIIRGYRVCLQRARAPLNNRTSTF